MKRMVLILCVAMFALWGCKGKSESNVTNNGSGSADSGSSGNGPGDNGSVSPAPTPPNPVPVPDNPPSMYIDLPNGFNFDWWTTTKPVVDMNVRCFGTWTTAEIINEKTGKSYKRGISVTDPIDCSFTNIELAPGDNPLKGVIRTEGGYERLAYEVITVTYNKTVDFVEMLKFSEESETSEGEANTVTATIIINDNGNLYKNPVKLVRKDNGSYKDVAVFNDSGVDGDVTAGDGVFTCTFKTDSLKEGEYTYRATATIENLTNASTPANIEVSVKDLFERQEEHRAEIKKIEERYFGDDFKSMSQGDKVAYMRSVAEKIKGTPGLEDVSVSDSGDLFLIFEHLSYVFIHEHKHQSPYPSRLPNISTDEQEGKLNKYIELNKLNSDKLLLDNGSSKRLNKKAPDNGKGKNFIGSDSAMFLSPFLHEFTEHDSFYRVRPMFAKSSDPIFNIFVALDEDARVDLFKNLSDFGVVIIDSHGFYRNKLNLHLITTGEKVIPELRMKYKSMLDKQALFESGLHPNGESYFLVSNNFFKKYLGKMPNALVYINACESGLITQGKTNALIDVFTKKGAGAFIGYNSNITTLYSAQVGDSLFTALLNDDPVKVALDKVKKQVSNDNITFVGNENLRITDNNFFIGRSFEEVEIDSIIGCLLPKRWSYSDETGSCRDTLWYGIFDDYQSGITDGKRYIAMYLSIQSALYQKIKIPDYKKTFSFSYRLNGWYRTKKSDNILFENIPCKRSFNVTLTDSEGKVTNLFSYNFSDRLPLWAYDKSEYKCTINDRLEICVSYEFLWGWKRVEVPIGSLAGQELELRFAGGSPSDFGLCAGKIAFDHITIQ